MNATAARTAAQGIADFLRTDGNLTDLEREALAGLDRDCPVCDGPLADVPITLVCVGIHPEDRKPSGWTTGGAVAVHAACAGVEAETPAPAPM